MMDAEKIKQLTNEQVADELAAGLMDWKLDGKKSDPCARYMVKTDHLFSDHVILFRRDWQPCSNYFQVRFVENVLFRHGKWIYSLYLTSLEQFIGGMRLTDMMRATAEQRARAALLAFEASKLRVDTPEPCMDGAIWMEENNQFSSLVL